MRILGIRTTEAFRHVKYIGRPSFYVALTTCISSRNFCFLVASLAPAGEPPFTFMFLHNLLFFHKLCQPFFTKTFFQIIQFNFGITADLTTSSAHAGESSQPFIFGVTYPYDMYARLFCRKTFILF